MKRIVSIFTFLLALTACQSTENGAALMVLESNVVFRVGNTSVTLTEFAQRLERDTGQAIAQMLAQGQTREQIEEMAAQAQVQQSLLENWVQEELLLQAARRSGVGVNAAAIDEALDASGALAFVPGTPFIDRTPERVDAVRQQLVLDMIARNTRADQYRIRQILVADEATATSVLAQLAAGTPFPALVAQFSQDPASLATEGELGWLALGSYVPELEALVFDVELNTPTKVQSPSGWHIFEVLERERERAFESIDTLRAAPNAQQLYEQTFLPWYEQLRADAEASGDVQFSPGFDPASVPLPFPEGT
jgi:peptidyl-prolyl cis-trans isomerase C